MYRYRLNRYHALLVGGLSPALSPLRTPVGAARLVSLFVAQGANFAALFPYFRDCPLVGVVPDARAKDSRQPRAPVARYPHLCPNSAVVFERHTALNPRALRPLLLF